MNIKNKDYEKMLQERSDSFLTYIGKASEEEMLKEFERWEKEASDIEVPKEIEHKMHKIIKDFEQKEKTKRRSAGFKRFSKIAALVIIIIATAFTAVVVSVDAFRLRVFDFLFVSNQEYTQVIPVESNIDSTEIKKVLPQDWKNVFYPEYLPKGYQLVETEVAGGSKTIYYQDNFQNVIIFSQEPADGGDVFVDNENVEKGEILINGSSAFWTSKNGQLTLIWNHNSYRFMLFGPIELEEMTKIAGNLLYIK